MSSRGSPATPRIASSSADCSTRRDSIRTSRTIAKACSPSTRFRISRTINRRRSQRTLAPAERSGSAVNPALYLGDTWRRSSALQLNYGVRLEGSTYGGAPAENALVDSAFGLRTNDFPSEVHLSPRVGFTWTLGQGGFGAPATIIRGGAGEFRSLTPSALFSAAEGATGVDGLGVAARVHRERRADARLERVRAGSVRDPDHVRVRNAARADHRAPERCGVQSRILARRARGARRSACSGAFSIASA